MTVEAAEAIKRYGVGVKCATITPDEARVREFGLKEMYRSPNGTIRNILGGVIFREPIVISNVPRLVPGWTKPIVIGRHAFGDQYRATDIVVRRRRPADAHVHARRRRAADRARRVRLSQRRRGAVDVQPRRVDPRFRARVDALRRWSAAIPLYLSTKNTILKRYDGRFKDIFQEIYRDRVQGGLRGGRPDTTNTA